MNENEISKIIVDSAIEVHREIGGPGLIEAVYEEWFFAVFSGIRSGASGVGLP